MSAVSQLIRRVLLGGVGICWTPLLVVAATALAVSAMPAAAADYPSVSELTHSLESEYHLNAPDIASNLTVLGRRTNSNEEPRLVRWIDPKLDIVIITTSPSTDDVDKFEGEMNVKANFAARSVNYCTEEVSVSSGGGYAPSINELPCFRQSHDVIVVIDASPTPPIMLFRDLRLGSRSPGEQADWAKRESAGRRWFDHFSCGTRLNKDLAANALTSGSSYIRVVRSDFANSFFSDDCFNSVSFSILGHWPIQTPDGKMLISSQMLQLLYSPDLHAGMTLSEVTKALEQ